MLFGLEVFESDPTSRTQAAPCLFDAAQETRVTFETVFEPILFRLEADHTPAGFPWRVMTISCVSASRRKRDDRP